jgi:hypothetical protein
MNIGASIFLIAVGAILTFALHVTVSGLDINVVGVILMLAGLALLIVDLLFWGPRRRTVPSAGRVVTEREVYDDRPPL